MTNRTKTLGVAAAFTAIAMSIPTAIAYGDPEPVPVASDIPDPQGSGCDTIKAELPAGTENFDGFAAQPASVALTNLPQLSTFSSAINGGLNPEVNVAAVLDNGPYVVFAPTDTAFAALPPEQLEALKADPAALLSVVYYHMALGYLGPDDVHGKLTSQQGAQITVTGTGGDIKVDDVAKVVCAGITGENAKIYMIDTVLDPANALPANATVAPTSSETSTTETSTTESTTTDTTTDTPTGYTQTESPTETTETATG